MNRLGAALCLSLTLATVASTRPAHAAVEVQAQISSRQIEVGEDLVVQVTLMSDSEFKPSNARLPVPAGLQVRGPNMSSRSQMSISMNGQMQRQTGVTLTWNVTAEKPGTYRLGPASVEVDGQRHQVQAFNIEVVAAGSRSGGAQPSRRRGFPFPMDPFGGFGFPPGFPFDNSDDEPEQPSIPRPPPEFEMQHAPDPSAFIETRVSPRKVVMGQAISLKVLVYGSQGPYSNDNLKEPSREGFLTFDVDIGPRVSPVQVQIQDRVWVAYKLREMVLFPIRTGTLRIGSVSLGFQGRGYPPTAGAQVMTRESAPIDITVVEPPLAGRPAGYRLGDVGHDYTLSATVEPRSVKQGDSVLVIAKLQGTGYVPTKLLIPQQNGVDWPEPTVIEKLDVNSGSVSGSRTFTFVVRLDRAGSVDLGELTLPYYDADQKRYHVARASLGSVEVKGDPAAAPVPSAGAAPGDRLKGLLSPRTKLGPYSATDSPLSARNGFFGLLLVGPLSVLAGAGLLRAGRRLSLALGTRRATPGRRALEELEAARALSRTGDLGGTSAAAERALHFALEGATGLKARGVLRRELASTLEARGLSPTTAKEAVDLLEALELARFVQGQDQGEAGGDAGALFSRSESLVQTLLRGKSG